MRTDENTPLIVPVGDQVAAPRIKVQSDSGIDIYTPTLPVELLAPLPPGFPANGLLLASANDKPLTLRATLDRASIDGYIEGDLVEVSINGELQLQRAITRAESDAAEITIVIPAPRAHGDYQVRYQLISDLVGNESGFSDPVFFFVDTRRPAMPNPGSLSLPPEVLPDGITDAVLTALGDVVNATIHSYSDRLPGDVITVVATGADGSTATSTYRIPLGGQDDLIQVPFTRDQLLSLGDGPVSFTYTIEDLAGNTSTTSPGVPSVIRLQEGITDLAPPVVPLFDDDGLIGEADARTPVGVDIPLNAKIQNGDRIVVIWGNTRSAPVAVTNADGTVEPLMSISIPYATVQAEGSGNIAVTYEVLRNGELLGTPAMAATVVVDLSQPGGDDADPNTPTNDNLGLPIVRKGGWVAPAPINDIPVEDSLRDATFVIPWLGASGTPSFQAGDVISLFYGVDPLVTPAATPFATYTVTPADVTSGVDLTQVLPFAKITEFGSGAIPAAYTATRVVRAADPANGITEVANTSYSRVQNVTVQSAAELPGGGGGLPVPVFMPLVGAPNNNLDYTRSFAAGGSIVRVLPYLNMQVGDRVRIHVFGFFGRNGDLGPVALAEFGHVGDTLLPGTPFEVTVTTPGQPIEFRYPWSRQQYFYSICQVTARVTVTNLRGSVTSPQAPMIFADTRANRTPPTDPSRPT